MTASHPAPDLSEAARLRRVRETLGFSQREMAEELGVAHGAVGLWETGARPLAGPARKLLELYEAELGLGGGGRGGLDRVRSSWAARSLSLSRTAAGVAARAAAGAVHRLLVDEERSNAIAIKTQTAIARRIVQTLGDMKGLAMKAGVMASYVDLDLPEATRQSLVALQGATRTSTPAAVAKVFLEELGAGPGKVFSEWSSEPFAAASIGQVHRARLKTGERVAVKVQYPGLLEALQSDLISAALIDRVAGLVFRGRRAGAFIQELRERVLEECDFRQEAAYQEQMRQLWAGRPGVRIPRVFPELCSRRILVTELAEGESLARFAARAPQEARDRAGETIYRFAFESIFRHGFFNCDPHPGNYLFGDGEVVFLDFGCCKRLEPQRRDLWRRLVRAVLEDDGDALARVTVEAEMVPHPARFDFQDHRQTMRAFYQPALDDDRFLFTIERQAHVWRTSSRNRNRFWIHVPPDWLLARKVQWGVYSILAQLRAGGHWRRATLPLLSDQPPEAAPRPGVHPLERRRLGTEA